MKLNAYISDHLINDNVFKLFWHGNKYHPPYNLSIEETEKINNVFGIDILFPSFEYRDNLIKELVTKRKMQLYQIYVGSIGKISKLRSLKKLMYKHKSSIKTTDFIETEIPIGTENSILAVVISINHENIDYCLENFWFPTNGFIIATKDKNIYSKLNLETIVKKTVSLSKNNHLSVKYNKLLLQLSEFNNENIILSQITDGGDNARLQIFANKTYTDELVNKHGDNYEILKISDYSYDIANDMNYNKFLKVAVS